MNDKLFILVPGDFIQLMDENYQPVGKPQAITEEVETQMVRFSDTDFGDVVRLPDGQLAYTVKPA